jgi:hypothetical protein
MAKALFNRLVELIRLLIGKKSPYFENYIEINI